MAQLLREGESPLTIRWPGGERWSASVFVLKPGDKDGLLELVGTGSIRHRSSPLYVLTSAEATIAPRDGGEVAREWHDNNRVLWRVDGGARVNVDDEVFYVEAGQEHSSGRLILPEIFIPGVALADPMTVPCEAPVQPLYEDENGCSRSIEYGIEWRQAGKVVENSTNVRGIVTLRLKDEQGFTIDRRRLLVLPSAFQIIGRLNGEDGFIQWRGLDGWRVAAIDDDGRIFRSVDGREGILRISWQDAPHGRQMLRLQDPTGGVVDLWVDLEANDLILVGPDGRVRRDRPDLSLPAMRGMTIRSGRKEKIDLELYGGGVPAIVMRTVEGVAPMASLHDISAMLLGLSQNRGPRVVVKDSGGREICRIMRPQDQPFVEGKMLLFPVEDDDNVTGIARTLVAPDKEHALEKCGKKGVYRLPERLDGPCLVYLRSGDAVTTRPVLVDGGQPSPARLKEIPSLARCALVEDEGQRNEAFRNALSDIADKPDAGAAIATLVRTIVSLRGLSPRALDWTANLPCCPKLLCRILLSAAEDEIDTILALERDLPFLWMAQPLSAWRSAIITELDRAVFEIESFVGSRTDAKREAGADIVRRLDAIASRAIWFSAVKKYVGFQSGEMESLESLAQMHVKNCADLTAPIPTRWIEEARRDGLPNSIEKLNYVRHTALVAPVLLARVALERLQMTPELNAALRSALDADRAYVASAFPHCLEFIAK